MNRGAWRAIVHGVAKSQTQLSTHTHTHTHTHTLCSKREFGSWLGALVDIGHKPRLVGRVHGEPSQTLTVLEEQTKEGNALGPRFLF